MCWPVAARSPSARAPAAESAWERAELTSCLGCYLGEMLAAVEMQERRTMRTPMVDWSGSHRPTWRLVPSTLASGVLPCGTVRACSSGRTVAATRAALGGARHTATAGSRQPAATSTRVSGLQTGLTVRALTPRLVVASTVGSGIRTGSLARGRRHGLMARVTAASTCRGRSTVLACIGRQRASTTKASSTVTRCTARAHTTFRMTVSMRASGRMAR
mmetsp:Transcript_33416/g.77602  ORF Transcript_33416/g.77602 Transcript_33416/m.77602 type:complete len:217 (-) Transcript_33416:383-1033(-)